MVKPAGKRVLVNLKRKGENIIKVALREIYCEDWKSMQVAPVCVQWC